MPSATGFLDVSSTAGSRVLELATGSLREEDLLRGCVVHFFCAVRIRCSWSRITRTPARQSHFWRKSHKISGPGDLHCRGLSGCFSQIYLLLCENVLYLFSFDNYVAYMLKCLVLGFASEV